MSEKQLSREAIQAQFGFLMGEVLTVVDAAVQGEQQNKATKDLVKGAFRSRANYLDDLMGISRNAQSIQKP